LMKTLAVMCMALQSRSPSRMPLSFKHASTCGVMLRSCRRSGTSNQNSFRKDFMSAPYDFPDADWSRNPLRTPIFSLPLVVKTLPLLMTVALLPVAAVAAELLRADANVPIEIAFTAKRAHADPFNG